MSNILRMEILVFFYNYVDVLYLKFYVNSFSMGQSSFCIPGDGFNISNFQPLAEPMMIQFPSTYMP